MGKPKLLLFIAVNPWEMRATGIQTQKSRPEYRALLILRSASALLTMTNSLLPFSGFFLVSSFHDISNDRLYRECLLLGNDIKSAFPERFQWFRQHPPQFLIPLPKSEKVPPEVKSIVNTCSFNPYKKNRLYFL